MEGFDIIGDIHGYANILEFALKEMGYKNRSGAYMHPTRQAIFVGDLINKGPDIKSTVEIVKAMVESGSAQCIIGNHEWNLLRLLKFSGKNDPDALRESDLLAQCVTTLDSYRYDQSALSELKQWIGQLPLYIENQYFRVVHAAWLPEDIDWLEKTYGPAPAAMDCIEAASNPSSNTSKVLQRLLNGVEWPFLSLNQGHSDTEPELELHRMAWWLNPDKAGQMEDLIVRSQDREIIPVNESKYRERFNGYPETAIPLFLGHYCLTDETGLQAHNVFCTDWCIYKNEALTVYRWSGETILISEHVYNFKPGS